MGFNEVRKDYLLNRWVVIATERGKRPTDFAKQQRQQNKQAATCPMEPGNEHMTPPAVLVYLKTAKGIKKTADKDNQRHKNWLIRCVPNLYPAFTPPREGITHKQVVKSKDLACAVGHHEVLVESPNHNEHPADARTEQLEHVITAYIDRLRELSTKPYVKYVSIFRNHGLEAGASLSHAHSQIIATPFVPRIIREEMDASKKLYTDTGKCAFCNIIRDELKGPRRIMDNGTFAAFAPYASVNPLEFWIAPKKHQASLLDMTKQQTKTFTVTLKTCLTALKDIANDPPYNYGFHMTADGTVKNHYHWHLEVYPQLAIWAGFEKSTGMYINTVTPESAAQSLRERIGST
jgi:UDPglucose--hexose-1-phosphate uridylyltransferase